MGLKVDAPNSPFSIGDSVIVTDLVSGKTPPECVRQIDHREQPVWLRSISILFGRETPVEISFNDDLKVL